MYSVAERLLRDILQNSCGSEGVLYQNCEAAILTMILILCPAGSTYPSSMSCPTFVPVLLPQGRATLAAHCFCFRAGRQITQGRPSSVGGR